jgi:hypothetical protein
MPIKPVLRVERNFSLKKKKIVNTSLPKTLSLTSEDFVDEEGLSIEATVQV